MSSSPATPGPTATWRAVLNRAREARTPTGGFSIRVSRDHETLFEEELGFATDSVVSISSGTKWLSSATIMSLVQDGLLSLDSRVEEFFPEYAGTTKGAITLAHILSFTSGLHSAACSGLSLAGCAEYILTLDLHAPPGAEFRYGGLAWQVAGRMAEIAAGDTPFPQLFQERIAGPLGMTRTSYLDPLNPSLSSGARSSLEDYDRFLKMIMNDGVFVGEAGGPEIRVLSAEVIGRMEEGWTARYGSTTKGLGGPNTRYGLGVWLERGNTARGEPDPARVSSRGSFGMSPWIDRTRDYRGLIFMHGSYLAASELFSDIVPLIEEALR